MEEKKAFTIRIEPSVIEAAQKIADAEERSRSQVIRRLIRDGIKLWRKELGGWEK